MAKNKNYDAILIQRVFRARLLHAVLFELIAVLLTTLLLAVVMEENMLNMGILSVIISLTATIWNSIYNYFFDWMQNRLNFSRTKWVRILHAITFESGLTLLTVPVVALYLYIDLWTAFQLESVLLLFMFPYSISFNYIYDNLYKKFFNSE